MDKDSENNSNSEEENNDSEEDDSTLMTHSETQRKCIKVSEKQFEPASKFLIRSKKKAEQLLSIKSNSMKKHESKNFPESIELKNRTFSNYEEFESKLNQFTTLKHLTLNNCTIENTLNKVLPSIPTLNCINFINCNDKIFQVFVEQTTLRKIAVHSDTKAWKGFPHDTLNKICANCKNLNHLELKGVGTGSYFDCNQFPYKISKLDATMISYHWYIGLKEPRINFLTSQKGSLKELSIDELPYDFDGGKVMKYLIDEMNLDKFYFKNNFLILKGEKQKIKELETSEIQITSACEMIRQFPSIEKFTLKLSNADISSDEIESILSKPTDIFKNINEFEVIDNSHGIIGVFLELFKKLLFVRKLRFQTVDRNFNQILKELPLMYYLKEIDLTTTEPKALERYQIIEKFAPNLKILKVSDKIVAEAQKYFRDRVKVTGNN